jgi:hypothetical protein
MGLAGRFLVLIASAWFVAFTASTPVPKVSPIPATAAPGHPSHDYPYFTTSRLVAKYDYAEEEFYVEGLAVEYVGAALQTASVAPGGPYPYRHASSCAVPGPLENSTGRSSSK